MKKRFLFLLVCLLYVSVSFGQTKLKWNAAYWMLGVSNMSVETPIFAKKWTFNSDVVYSPWKSVDGNAFNFLQIIPEIRYYPRGAFDGFYVGGYFAWHFFRLTKWNYINMGMYQKGNGLSVGAVLGYQVDISERWSLDVYAGGGFQDSGYRGYYTKTDEMCVGWNRSAEWMPYKLGISFAYKLKCSKK